MAEMTLAQVRETGNAVRVSDVALGFGSSNAFTEIQRVGKMFASSSMVPKEYVNNPANCTIAVEIALRMKISPLMVMHNMYVIRGRPSWSTPFLISCFNNCGRYHSIEYTMLDADGKKCEEGETPFGCYCHSIEKATNRRIYGTLVTMDIAKAEGWLSKTDSKWKTMPEQMLRYRAAAWFIRAYAPEVAMGLYTDDEVEDFDGENIKVVSPANTNVEKIEEKSDVVEAFVVEAKEDMKKISGLKKQLIEAIAEYAGPDREAQEEFFRKLNGGSDKHSMSDIESISVSAAQYLLTRIRQIESEGEEQESEG